jgi:hypothetical protein
MKKVAVGIIISMLSVITLVPSQASSQKSLVIIDSYFDSSVYSSNVVCVTIKSQPCTDVVTAKNTSLSSEINHGNAMAEVAKKQNPGMSIILLRSGAASKNSVAGVNAGNFIDALNWVSANKSRVGAVSVSRFFNGNKECSPSSVNTAPFGGVAKADSTIRSLISSLKNDGIPVFVSTGNKQGTKIDYPACILDTVSVSTGSRNSSGTIVSVNALDENTDYVASASVSIYTSKLLGLIPQTTSSATVAVAAQWLTAGSLNDKVVLVTP